MLLSHHLVTIDVADKHVWLSYVDRPTFEHHFAIGDIGLLDEDMYGYLRQPDMVLTYPTLHGEIRRGRYLKILLLIGERE